MVLLEFHVVVIVVDNMVKVCKSYYMIDVYVDGVLIRPRKYRKEYTNLSSTWYDYLGNEISDPAEIARIEAQATPDREVDESYDDYMSFMELSVSHDSLLIPTSSHFVQVGWTPSGGVESLRMDCKRGIEGDSYLIYVKNEGAAPGILYLPERGNDGDVDNTPVNAEYINVQPQSTYSVRATFRNGVWFYEVVAKPETSSQPVVVINDPDYLVFRYLWESDAGSDLDTATEILNSGIPGVDNNAVGWSCPGNDSAIITSLLKWGGDNTASGAECVWMSTKELRDNYKDVLPPVTDFMTYASWFGSRGTGKASFNLIAYKGGTMHQQGYNFINEGGVEVYNKIHSFEVNTSKGMPNYKTEYTPVTKISYNKTTNTVSMAVGDTVIDNQESMAELYSMFNNYLAKDNTTPYTPAEDFNPATKVYVDDLSPIVIHRDSEYNVTPVNLYDVIHNSHENRPIFIFDEQIPVVNYYDQDGDRSDIGSEYFLCRNRRFYPDVPKYELDFEINFDILRYTVTPTSFKSDRVEYPKAISGIYFLSDGQKVSEKDYERMFHSIKEGRGEIFAVTMLNGDGYMLLNPLYISPLNGRSHISFTGVRQMGIESDRELHVFLFKIDPDTRIISSTHYQFYDREFIDKELDAIKGTINTLKSAHPELFPS